MRLTSPAAGLLSLACVCAAALAVPELAQERSADLSTSVEAREHLRRGVELARQGLHEGAVAEFRKCIAIEPRNADARFQMGRSLLNLAIRHQAPLSEVVDALEEALRIDPQRDYVRMQLAEVYCIRRPNHFAPEKATSLFEQLIERHPDRFEIRLSFAACLTNSEIRVARRADPNKVLQDSAWTQDLIRFHSEKAIDQVPVNSESAVVARTMLAEAQFRMGEFDAARSINEYLIQEYGGKGLDLGHAWETIGHCYYKKGKYKEAAQAFRAAHDAKPDIKYRWDIRLAYDALGGYPVDLPERYRFPLRQEAIDPASPPARFTDIAPELGINRSNGAGPNGWADTDGDGLYDLVSCGCDTFCTLYRAKPGGFFDATIEARLTRLEPGFGSVWADYDNDGDVDLYIARNGWNGPAPDSLMRNNGDGTFTDVGAAAGLADSGSSFNATWFDYDRDGWLDLIVTNGVYLDGSTNRLYRNKGDGTFDDVTSRAGLLEKPFAGTIGLAVGDFDDDGWLDVFYHGRGGPNRLYRNDGDGTFTDVADAAGVIGPREQNGYIAFLADLDSDGDLDIFTGSLAAWEQVLAGYAPGYKEGEHPDKPKLYRNMGEGKFKDVSLAAGFRYPHGVMAAGVADLDNDGYLDIYLGNGNPELRRREPNILYHNRGGVTFEDVTRYSGVGGMGKGHGISFLDWDGDGDLEIYAQYGGFFHGDFAENAFYRNESGNTNNWLSIRLHQGGGNHEGIGARVTVRAGDLVQTRHLLAGNGFGSTDPPILHYGVGQRKTVDGIEIRWPDGSMQTLGSQPVNRTLRIEKPDPGRR